MWQNPARWPRDGSGKQPQVTVANEFLGFSGILGLDLFCYLYMFFIVLVL